MSDLVVIVLPKSWRRIAMFLYLFKTFIYGNHHSIKMSPSIWTCTAKTACEFRFGYESKFVPMYRPMSFYRLLPIYIIILIVYLYTIRKCGLHLNNPSVIYWYSHWIIKIEHWNIFYFTMFWQIKNFCSLIILYLY